MKEKVLVGFENLRENLRLDARLTERALTTFLKSMKRGRLTLKMPDARELCFGDGAGVKARIEIKSPEFFTRCLLFGDIGFGESYVEGEWETDDLIAVFEWCLLNQGQARYRMINLFGQANRVMHRLKTNSRGQSIRNIQAHYDQSNEFFSLFLDPTMTYSSGIFANETMSLAEAQVHKVERMLNLLDVRPNDSVLEIGSGWGFLSTYAAKTYGCKVKTITISQKQFDYASALVKREGLEDRVEVVLQDYRDVEGQFDKIVSIEMIEAVGDKYFETFFEKCRDLLRPEGRLGIQTILYPDHKYEAYKNGTDWVQKHIFPGGLVPAFSRLQEAVHSTGDLALFDFKDIGLSYARTLREWRERFHSNRAQIMELGFEESFLRKWNYYFDYCRAGFLCRNVSAAQIVYVKP
ncbi:MAG: cyclopropane-fatty-acyl-phospholipid synthase family protein [Bdellovibrionia bacterium]